MNERPGHQIEERRPGGLAHAHGALPSEARPRLFRVLAGATPGVHVIAHFKAFQIRLANIDTRQAIEPLVRGMRGLETRHHAQGHPAETCDNRLRRDPPRLCRQ